MIPTTEASILTPEVLLALGVILIALEVFVASFVIIWFGIGALVIGVVSYFYSYESVIWQLAHVFVVSFILLYLLRKKIKACIMKVNDESNDDFLNVSGVGVIKNNKVFYRGTYWDYDSNNEYKEGDKVTVLSASKNTVVLDESKML